MRKYFSPEIKSYNSEQLLEGFGPAQSAYVNVDIRATAFNSNTPVINRYADTFEHRLVRVSSVERFV